MDSSRRRGVSLDVLRRRGLTHSSELPQQACPRYRRRGRQSRSERPYLRPLCPQGRLEILWFGVDRSMGRIQDRETDSNGRRLILHRETRFVYIRQSPGHLARRMRHGSHANKDGGLRRMASQARLYANAQSNALPFMETRSLHSVPGTQNYQRHNGSHIMRLCPRQLTRNSMLPHDSKRTVIWVPNGGEPGQCGWPDEKTIGDC